MEGKVWLLLNAFNTYLTSLLAHMIELIVSSEQHMLYESPTIFTHNLLFLPKCRALLTALLASQKQGH